MGGLRRPNPPAAPPPPSNYQPLSLADVPVADLPKYPHDPVNNDRILLDSTRLDFDDALHNRSSPNNFDAKQNHPRSQPASSAYPNLWESSAFLSVNPTPAALPPDSFDLSDNLAVDPTLNAFVSGVNQPRKVDYGPYVQRLINFNRDQRQGTKNDSLECFWRPLIASYFAPEATLCINLDSSDSRTSRVKMPIEVLPRLWKSKFDAGMKEERMLLEDPCEHHLPDGVVVVECPRALIVTVYEYSVVLTDGHLRVTFQRNKKILEWEFSLQKYEELFTRAACGELGAKVPSSCSEFGLPESVYDMMKIANAVNNIADNIMDEVAKIASDPQKVSNVVDVANSAEQRMNDAFPNILGQSSGHAFRAISSVFDRASLDGGMPSGSVGTPHGGTAGGSSSTRGIAGDADFDVKNATRNETIVPNLRDVMSSWKLEQLDQHQVPGQQNVDQQHIAVFPNLLDEAVRSPFLGGGGEHMQGMRRGYGDLNLPTKTMDANMNDAHSKQMGQSAVDAATAAASGQGGWGAMSPTRTELDSNEIEGDGLDTSMHLLNTATDASLTLRCDSRSGARNKMPRQGAPPGLSMFTPQSNDVERSKQGATRRSRGGKGGSRRGMNSGNSRATSNVGGLKDFKEGVRGLQRAGSGKAKRGSGSDYVHEGMGGSNDKGTSATSQEQNGGIGFGKKGSRSDVVKGGKDDGHGSSGTRRGSTRNLGTEERLEKRQKTGQGGDQK